MDDVVDAMKKAGSSDDPHELLKTIAAQLDELRAEKKRQEKAKEQATTGPRSYIGEDALTPAPVPTSASFDKTLSRNLGLTAGTNPLHPTNSTQHVNPVGKTVSVSVNTAGPKGRKYVVSAHDMRKHAVTRPANAKSKRAQSTGGVHLEATQYGPVPKTDALRAVAADLGLYPDYVNGVDIQTCERDSVPETVADLCESMRGHLKTAATSAQSVTGVNTVTILAYEHNLKLVGCGVSFDFRPVDVGSQHRSATHHREQACFKFPDAADQGDTGVSASVTVTMCEDNRGHGTTTHLYLGEGVAEVKRVYKVRMSKSTFTQVLVVGSEDVVHELVLFGSRENPRYMQSSSYICCGDAPAVYRQLGPYLGHAVYLTAAGAFMDTHAFTFSHNAPIVLRTDKRRVSHTLYSIVESQDALNVLHAWLAHFSHHCGSHHTSLTLVVDDAFWATALSDFEVDDNSVRLTQQLAVLFLLRRAAGRSVQIVDVSAHGVGTPARLALQLAVHADSWSWLWVAAALHDSRGTMALLPRRDMAEDHDEHHALGTRPLQNLLSEYVRSADLDKQAAYFEKVTVKRFRGAARLRLLHDVVVHRAAALGYFRFPKSAYWDSAARATSVNRSLTTIIRNHTCRLDCPNILEATLGILQHAPARVLDSSDRIVRFCASANVLLTMFLTERDSTMTNATVCTSAVDIDEPVPQELRDAVTSATDAVSAPTREWMTEFASWLAAADVPATRLCSSTVLMNTRQSTKAGVKRGKSKKGREKEKKKQHPTDDNSGDDGVDGADNGVYLMCPDAPADLELVLNGGSTGTETIVLPETGVFSFVVLNTLMHEMMLVRAAVPWSLARLMTHVVERPLLEHLTEAMLDLKNTAAYAPAWYTQSSMEKQAPSVFMTLKPTPEAVKANPDISKKQRSVWNTATVPWWTFCERALGWRMQLEYAGKGPWDAFVQPTGPGSPIKEMTTLALNALGSTGDEEEQLVAAVKAAAAAACYFTWGPRAETFMLTPLTITLVQGAKSM